MNHREIYTAYFLVALMCFCAVMLISAIARSEGYDLETVSTVIYDAANQWSDRVTTDEADAIAHAVAYVSETTGLPVYTVLAHAWQETRFDAGATGTSGEVGLWQQMPQYVPNGLVPSAVVTTEQWLSTPSGAATALVWHYQYLQKRTSGKDWLCAYNRGLAVGCDTSGQWYRDSVLHYADVFRRALEGLI